MGHSDVLIERRPFLLAHGDRLCARELSDGTPSPDGKCWLTDTSDFLQRATSKSPSLHSLPSTCSTQDFPPTPPTSTLRLPQVPVIPTIRHRTPQACDKCRERKTKCSGHRPTCVRCNSRGLSCKYSPRETRIRSSLKSRAWVPTFDNRPLFGQPMEEKTVPCGFPTPAHHSRMGFCQTNAFTLSPDAHDDPKVPTTPLYATIPASGGYMEKFVWNPLDLVPPPVPVAFRCSNWARISGPSRVDKTRRPLHTSLPLLDTSLVKDHSHNQIQRSHSVVINQRHVDYPRINPRPDALYFPSSKEAGHEPFSHSGRGHQALHPPTVESQSALGFNEGHFSFADIEGFF